MNVNEGENMDMEGGGSNLRTSSINEIWVNWAKKSTAHGVPHVARSRGKT